MIIILIVCHTRIQGPDWPKGATEHWCNLKATFDLGSTHHLFVDTANGRMVVEANWCSKLSKLTGSKPQQQTQKRDISLVYKATCAKSGHVRYPLTSEVWSLVFVVTCHDHTFNCCTLPLKMVSLHSSKFTSQGYYLLRFIACNPLLPASHESWDPRVQHSICLPHKHMHITNARWNSKLQQGREQLY